MDGSSLDAPVVDLSGDTDWHCHFERGKRCLAEGNYESAFATFCNIVRLQPETRHCCTMTWAICSTDLSIIKRQWDTLGMLWTLIGIS
jgi:hypothetical protein